MTAEVSQRRIHFVTGKLAANALHTTVADLADELDFAFSIDVLPITVAALMTPEWIARHVQVPPGTSHLLLPGYCHGDISVLQQMTSAEVDIGPKDLRQLPQYFGRREQASDYGSHEIEIIAEINHAPRKSIDEILVTARSLADQGADVIDVGCDPGATWEGVSKCVEKLVAEGLRVSIDSFNVVEVEAALTAGAQLVLSVNSSNVDHAVKWNTEVVVIPDDPRNLASMERTAEQLESAGVPYRLDPILEPIGFGFAASLSRYAQVREKFPEAEMMMGIGNLTELTDVDSAGVNVLLLGFCQELNIHSVLTTQVIPWAQSSVRECDLARRLVHYAVRHGVPPKHVDPRLVMLRDGEVHEHGEPGLARLAQSIKDHNYRLFAERGELHLLASDLNLSDTDAFELFEKLLATEPRNIDERHAFYLGYELAKGTIALTLGKNYVQDEALNWGFLTRTETSHRERMKQRRAKGHES